MDVRRHLERYCRGYNRCASIELRQRLVPDGPQRRAFSACTKAAISLESASRPAATATVAVPMPTGPRTVTKRPRRIELRTSDTAASRPTSIRNRAGGLALKPCLLFSSGPPSALLPRGSCTPAGLTWHAPFGGFEVGQEKSVKKRALAARKAARTREKMNLSGEPKKDAASRDKSEFAKSRDFRPYFAWLATQCTSHPSPAKFPANREFYRENHDFRPQDDNSRAKNRCAAGTFRQIP